ncbi:unnamed protein product, partial [Pleuronectes platessa]
MAWLQILESWAGNRIVDLARLEDEHRAGWINIMEVLSVLDSVKTNVVHVYENLQQRGHTCLVFEKLDRSLDELLSDGHNMPLSVSEIRPIAHQ